jgi:hypothetical protein
MFTQYLYPIQTILHSVEMARYVQHEVNIMADDPEAGAHVELLVGTTGPTDPLEEFLKESSGEVLEELPFETLRITLPQTLIERLKDVEGVESIERDEEGEVQGNSSSHPA